MVSQEKLASMEAPQAAPRKKSLFKKSHSVSTVDEDVQGIDLFSRAKQMFPVIVENQDRKREKKLVKEERARSSGSAERVPSSPRDTKRRRVTPHEHEQEERGSLQQSRERSLVARENTYPTGSQARSQSTSLTQKYTNEIAKSRPPLNVSKGYISLSDGSDDEDIQVVDDRPQNLTGWGVTSEPFNIDKPFRNPDNDEDQQSDEEYPELVAAAAERKRKQALEKETAHLAFLNRNHDAEDIFETTQANHDPQVQILITSRIQDSRPLVVQRRYTQSLRLVRLEWCRRQLIGGEPLSQEDTKSIFFTWNLKKLYDLSSCADLGLGLDHEGNLQHGSDSEPDQKNKVHFEAWTEELFNAHKKWLLEQEEAKDHGASVAAAESTKGSKMKIILRSRDYEDMRLYVPKSNGVQRIMDTFRKHNQVPMEQTIVLQCDGEIIDPSSTLEDTDLEDMDIVEVLVK